MTNNSFRFLQISVVVVSAILSVSCSESNINITFSANLSDHLEDCGCVSGKMGGIARRVGVTP